MITHQFSNHSNGDFKPTHISLCVDSDHVVVKLEERPLHQWHYLRFSGAPTMVLDRIEASFGLGHVEKLRIGQTTDRFALIPNEHYHSSRVYELAAGSFFLEEEESLGIDSVYSASIKNIFVSEATTWSAWTERIGAIHEHHLLSPLISFLPKDRDRIYAIFGTEHLSILGVKDGKLQLAKLISQKDHDLWLYEVLNAYRSIGLNTHKDALFLGGRLMPTAQIMQSFKRFVGDIHWLRIPDVESDDAHLFYDVYLLSKYF